MRGPRIAAPVWAAAALALLVVSSAAGCGAFRGPGGAGEGGEPHAASPTAEAEFERAVRELDGRTPRAGARRLLAVWRRCGTSPLGERALLLYAAEALQPRASASGPVLERPATAAAAAARLIRTPGRSRWSDRVARGIYLAGIELSGRTSVDVDSIPQPVDEPEACPGGRRTIDVAGELPVAPPRPLAERYETLLERAASLRDRAGHLEIRSASLLKELRRLKELLVGPEGGS